jgi:hypothetical protein
VRHWIVAAALFCVWAVGVALASPPNESRMAWLTIGFAVPVVSMGAQLPPWIARQWIGWRITQAEFDEEMPSERPLTIRGLMLATLLVAVTFAIARLVPFSQDKEFGPVLGVWFFGGAIISVIGMLPAGGMLLGMQRFRMALIWSGVYAATLISLVWIGRELLIRYALNSGPPLIAFVMLSGLMVGYATTLVVAGTIARANGYRLVRARDRR